MNSSNPENATADRKSAELLQQGTNTLGRRNRPSVESRDKKPEGAQQTIASPLAPAPDPSPPAPDPSPPAPDPSPPDTILAVDDTSESLALLVHILTQAGYPVRAADSGELALAAVAAQAPDLILLDVRMPGVDGLEVCRRLKARDQTRHIPIILISAFADEKEWVAGLRLGAADYVTKPFRREELLMRVKTHLNLRRASISLEQQTVAIRQTNEQLRAESAERQRVEDELFQSLDRAEDSRRAMQIALEHEKRANEALNASEVRYRRLFETAKDGILILDAETGMIVAANPFLIEMLGLSYEYMLTKTIWELGFLKDIAANLDKFLELQEQVYVRYQDLPLETADGRSIAVEFISNVYLVGHRKVIQCNIRDISERKRAKEKLRAANTQLEQSLQRSERTRRVTLEALEEQKRTKEELRQLNTELEQRVQDRTADLEVANHDLEAFSYSVSHDLRAPLRAINGYATIVREEHAAQLDAEGRRMLESVASEGRRMGQLIDDLLAFSRLGLEPLRRAHVDMEDLARTVWAELAGREAGRTLQLALEPLPPACGDPAMLRQVWVNLLGNAVKYTGTQEAAEIRIGSRTEAGETVYFVQDNGAGFDMKCAGKLFGVFQRLHSGAEFEGTGVGLALVQRIVQRHGGRVWAEAKIDAGATFSFTLPGGE